MKEFSIKDNKLRAIRYCVISASVDHKINNHPQKQMKDLGIHLVAAVPETIADCWICLTDYQGELPDYITEIKIKPHDRYWQDMCKIDLVE